VGSRGIVALGAAAGIVGLTVLGLMHPRPTPAAATPLTPSADIPPATAAAMIPTSTVAATTPTTPTTPTTVPGIVDGRLTRPLVKGAFGSDVAAMQQRLTELGFVTGPADGAYGDLTQQAVWAFKKLVMGATPESLRQSDTASLVDDSTWQAMQSSPSLAPRRPQGAGSTHVEIVLPLQLLMVYVDDRPVIVSHISSGDGERWCETLRYDTDEQGRPLPTIIEREECGISKTPGGVFRVHREVSGKRVGPLGGMYDPLYFNYGIAIHGAKNVPLEPASHGCIRVNMTAGQAIAAVVDVGHRVFVWGEDGREPEQYSRTESLPVFNFPNPDARTKTSTAGTSP
jgi:hypothetical protein